MDFFKKQKHAYLYIDKKEFLSTSNEVTTRLADMCKNLQGIDRLVLNCSDASDVSLQMIAMLLNCCQLLEGNGINCQIKASETVIDLMGKMNIGNSVELQS